MNKSPARSFNRVGRMRGLQNMKCVQWSVLAVAGISLLFSGCGYEWPEGEVINDVMVGPHTQATYEVNVYLPPGFETDASGLPLVLVLDGDMGFSDVATLVDEAIETGLAEPVVLLGVGNQDWRGMDMTPTPVGSEPSGGIASYFDWIETELVPAAEAEYGCGGSRENRIVTGHSYGGLATTWAMLERNDFGAGLVPRVRRCGGMNNTCLRWKQPTPRRGLTFR